MSDIAPRARVDVLGVPFDCISEAETVQRIREAVRQHQRLWIATANVDYVMRAYRNIDFKRTLLQANLIVADGVPVLWAAHLQGQALAGRVNGTDLVWHCATLSAELHQPIALIGGAPDVAEAAAARMQAYAPGARVIAIPTPTPLTSVNSRAVLNCIEDAHASILLVGLSTGPQEAWIAEHWPHTEAPVVIGVGGSFDLISNRLSRAPRWMQRNGLEWLYRLGQEPQRLWRRYLLDDAPFVGLVVQAAIKQRIRKR